MPSVFGQRDRKGGMARSRAAAGHYAAALALAAMLTACGGEGSVSAVPGAPLDQDFFGAVAGSDPHAVLAARRVLVRGGAAADAAAAYFFMAAVSSPATVSLAAGGACMNYDAGSNRAGLLDFRNAAQVPGAVRGMMALHARSGALAWQELVTPAERAARFGIPAPRALAQALRAGGGTLLRDEAAAAIFGGEGGGALAAGEPLVQADLADMLSIIRTRGAGDFYGGETARRLVAAAARAGTAIAADALRAYAPAWRETRRRGLPQGILGAEAIVHAPGEGFAAGAAFVAAFDGLRAGEAPPPQASAPASPTSAVVAADGFGNASACLFTLDAPFGARRLAPGTGIVLAAAPSGGGGLLPVIAVNETTRELSFAGTAAGGSGAAAALAGILTLLADGDTALDDAFRLSPWLPAGAPERLEVVFCPDGLRNGAASCRAATDPRGLGFATVR